MFPQKLVTSLIICFFLTISFTPFTIIGFERDNRECYQIFFKSPHKPIYINGNNNFTESNGVISGNGTVENPYIIEDWNIRINVIHLFKQNHGISIRDTNVYFVIRNCYIHFFDGSIAYLIGERILRGPGSNGINLFNVSNGLIDNCYVKGMDGSINLENNSYNNTIKNCKCWRNKCGIGINRYSENNTVENCITMNYGCSICLWDNTYNNKIINCSCKIAPIRIKNSSYNEINNCSLSYCFIGIDIFDNSSNNIIKKCNFYRCKSGLEINKSSDCNLIYQNNFVKNKKQANDQCNNQWDNGSFGNYWSDYKDIDEDGNGIWDNPRDICGGNNKDRFPLVNQIDC